jgi:Cu(I)/Ag(I) efflux system membrane fusion protein
MHPQVVKHEMGTCPICAMDLVPFEKNSDDKSIKLDAQRQLLANIATIRIGDATNVQTQSVLNGRLVINPEQSNYISAKIAGRVEQLYVRETGVPVKKGQALYQLYSEQLCGRRHVQQGDLRIRYAGGDAEVRDQCQCPLRGDAYDVPDGHARRDT